MLAVQTRAQEEFILVFVGVFLLALIVTPVFFAARLVGAQAVRQTGLWLMGGWAAALASVFLWSAWRGGSIRSDGALLGSLALAGLATVATQWLIARWRMRAPTKQTAQGRASAV